MYSLNVILKRVQKTIQFPASTLVGRGYLIPVNMVPRERNLKKIQQSLSFPPKNSSIRYIFLVMLADMYCKFLKETKIDCTFATHVYSFSEVLLIGRNTLGFRWAHGLQLYHLSLSFSTTFHPTTITILFGKLSLLLSPLFLQSLFFLVL